MAKLVSFQTKDKEVDFTEKEAEYWQKLTEGHVSDLDLFTACAIGDLDCVKSYLSQTNSQSDIVNTRNSEGWTPLMYACFVGHEKILELLIHERADILAKEEKHGMTSLALASSSGNTSVVKRLVEKGAGVNVVDDKNQTALFHATEQGHWNVVKLLLKFNADILISQNGTGYTPFMEAARQGHVDVFNAFLDHGIDLSLVCRSGLTALGLAYKNSATTIVSIIENHLKPWSLSLRDEPDLNIPDLAIGDIQQPRLKVHRWLSDHNHGIVGPNKQSHPVSIECGVRSRSVTDAYGKSFETIVDSDRTPVGTPVDSNFFHQYMLGDAMNYGRYLNYSLPSLEMFLRELHLDKYQKVFDEQSVDFRVLISLTEDDFKELGLKLGPRRKLNIAITKWKQETAHTVGTETGGQELDSLKRQLVEVAANLQRVKTDLACEQEARSSLEAEQMVERARRSHIYYIGGKVQRSCQELRNNSTNLRERVNTLETSALATMIDEELHSKLKTLHKQMANDIQNTDNIIDIILRRVRKIMSDDPTELSASESDSPESSCTSISKSEGSIDYS